MRGNDRKLSRTTGVVVAATVGALALGAVASLAGSASASPGAPAPAAARPAVTAAAVPPAFRAASVQVFTTHVAPLATIGGVTITGGGYGSSLARVPGTTDEFYGLTDRGPNVDGPNGTKVEPLPDFDPAIGKFRFTHGRAVLLKTDPAAGRRRHAVLRSGQHRRRHRRDDHRPRTATCCPRTRTGTTPRAWSR